MGLVISNQAKMSSGWAMIIFTLCFTEVGCCWLICKTLYCMFMGKIQFKCMFYEGEKVMKIDLMDWNGEKSYALYDNFRVADEKVSLHLLISLCKNKT